MAKQKPGQTDKMFLLLKKEMIWFEATGSLIIQFEGAFDHTLIQPIPWTSQKMKDIFLYLECLSWN